MITTVPLDGGIAARLRGIFVLACRAALVVSLSGCASRPLQTFTADTTPMMLVPVSAAGVTDERARFREIFCAVLDERHAVLPDHVPCEQALTTLVDEPDGMGDPVTLEPSRAGLTAVFVPGIGWDCFSDWLKPQNTVGTHLQSQGYGFDVIDIDSLSSSSANARRIRDAVLAMKVADASPSLVLIGYSKGAVDVLEAVTQYPEIRPRIAAIVSLAGAINGSPLANTADQFDAALLRHWPGARCTEGDGGALDSLRPAVRQHWLARNPLPKRHARVLRRDDAQAAEHLRGAPSDPCGNSAQIDERNDGPVLVPRPGDPGQRASGVSRCRPLGGRRAGCAFARYHHDYIRRSQRVPP